MGVFLTNEPTPPPRHFCYPGMQDAPYIMFGEHFDEVSTMGIAAMMIALSPVSLFQIVMYQRGFQWRVFVYGFECPVRRHPHFVN